MASSMVGISVDGIAGINSALIALGGKEARSAARKAANKANQITLKKARALVPQDTGLLKKSLIKKTKTYTRSGTIVSMIGPDSKAQGNHPVTGKLMRPIKYAHIVEKLKAFLGPAQRSTATQVVAAFTRETWINIKKSIVKQAAKARAR